MTVERKQTAAPGVGGQSLAPLFIVGCGRSGTTLLREILNSHPNIAIPPECPFLIQYLSRPAMPPKRAARLLLGEPLIHDWSMPLSPGEFEHCCDIIEVVVALHKSYLARTHGTRWGQKTPKFVRHLPLLAAAFPDARFVHVIRDGRAVAASYKRAPWGPTNVVAAAVYWQRNVTLGRQFAARHPERMLTVKYESLSANPEDEARRALEFLGEPFDPRVVQYEKHTQAMLPPDTRSQFGLLGGPVSKTRATAWRDELAPREIELFERTAGGLLSELGYPRLFPDAKPLGRLGRRLWLVRDVFRRMANHARRFPKMPRHYLYEVRRRIGLLPYRVQRV